ncbi:ubiquitin carboxyl-terminal hydrolase 31, partial [Pteropus vampyrus]|uniref:ubiquitinyl hydrolase 1 n=1 Tax=Pteropus vampyrus TaxID=132908 RepID=A0A6P6BLA7_PTEVA
LSSEASQPLWWSPLGDSSGWGCGPGVPLGRACSEPRLGAVGLPGIPAPSRPSLALGTVSGLSSEPGLTRLLPICSPAQSIVSKNALQYRGNAQHDAQEFLLWLLDRVHEDLHHAVKQGGPPPVKPPSETGLMPEGPSFPVCSTFVQELFQAQYRYEPANRVNRNIVLTEMYYDGFHRSFCDTDDLETVHESDCIFAFETPERFRPEGILSQRGIHLSNNLNHLKFGLDHPALSSTQAAAKPGSTDSPPTRAGGDRIVLLVCNRACSGQQGKRFGPPFVLHLERTVAWDVLQKEILEKMKYFLRPTVCIQVCPFSLRVVSVVGITYLLPQEEQPLRHPAVERALKSCGPGGTAHVKLVVEWDKETKDFLFVNTEDEYIPDAESVRLQRERHHQPQTCTLSQCFQLYTKEERLAPDDAWRCPHCKQLQQGSITLSLWTLPDVLIVHLKRFRQVRDPEPWAVSRALLPSCPRRVAGTSAPVFGVPLCPFPEQNVSILCPPKSRTFQFVLFKAQSRLRGQRFGVWCFLPAFFPYCKNSVDGLWYCFDDSDVQQLPEEEVCTQAAYILFYQRRTAIPAWSANSSVAGSTSSSLCEHWVSRLPGSKPASATSAASSRRTSLASLSESVEMTGERSEDDGGFSTRPFVRSVQRQSLSSRSSVTSPLAVSENCIRPSWSLSAKLHMRSSSPSRFSGDSPVHSSASTLEKIGEAADDKVSVSCFGSLRNLSGSYQEAGDSRSRREHKAPGRAPLAVMESVFRDEPEARRLDAGRRDAQGRSSAPGDRLPPDSDPFDNNNQIAYVDQSDSVDSSPVREARASGHPGSLSRRPEGTSQKPPNSRGTAESGGSSRKGRSVLASQESSLSSTSPSSPVPAEGSGKPSRSRTRADSSRASGRHSSSAPGRPRKESSPKAQGPAPCPSPQKPKPAPALTHTASSTAARRGPGPAPRAAFPAGKGRTGDRALSREGSRHSLLSDRAGAPSGSKPGSPRAGPARAGEGRGNGRHVRSSSMASLRSPGPSAKAALKRDSKSDEKGLSFFRSALRQKEARRSTDLGKTTLLSKKAGRDAGDGKAEKGPQPPGRPQPNAGAPGKEQLAPRDPASARHSLLSSRKSRAPQLDAGAPSSPGGRQSAEKPSKKLPASMPTSARPSQKPQ